jgi:hypothetical protein
MSLLANHVVVERDEQFKLPRLHLRELGLGLDNVPAVPVDIAGIVDTLVKLGIREKQCELAYQGFTKTPWSRTDPRIALEPGQRCPGRWPAGPPGGTTQRPVRPLGLRRVGTRVESLGYQGPGCQVSPRLSMLVMRARQVGHSVSAMFGPTEGTQT